MTGSDPLTAAGAFGRGVPARSTRRAWANRVAGQISFPIPGQRPSTCRPSVRPASVRLPGVRLPGAPLPRARLRQAPAGGGPRLVIPASVRLTKASECHATMGRGTGPSTTRTSGPGIRTSSLGVWLCAAVR